jgi:aryl-alcohol dehydrogenase-like predicted oxidoreductase
VVIPIPGASRPESITDSARAAELELSTEELARLDQARPGWRAGVDGLRSRLRRAGQ